jgi:hypothetical protein
MSRYDRQSVGQSVFVSGAHLGPATNFFLLEIFFRQLRFCNFVAPSLTRERVCIVQLLLGLARAVTLESKYRRTHGHILLSLMRLPQPAGPGSRISIPPEQGGPVTPGHWVLFLSPLKTRRDYGGYILTHLHTGYNPHHYNHSYINT